MKAMRSFSLALSEPASCTPQRHCAYSTVGVPREYPYSTVGTYGTVVVYNTVGTSRYLEVSRAYPYSWRTPTNRKPTPGSRTAAIQPTTSHPLYRIIRSVGRAQQSIIVSNSNLSRCGACSHRWSGKGSSRATGQGRATAGQQGSRSG
ncbi:hypothetical protein HaLaN_29378 [Haematococcus lacustris]|uniref:Uncharacterized protein n=1 Tax=Haematococcus lacustris TaxID=44745 RepID=A0A6A0ACM5_HAELA|nr:hypothetical protein HaLaN_29378 [Haematococcus lacustris]